MVKIIGPSKPIFIGGAVVALLMLWTFSAFPSFQNMLDVAKMTISPEKDGASAIGCPIVSDQGVNLGHDPVDQTFYDDPTLSYSMGNPMKDWDKKRREWLNHHPSFANGAEDRIFVVTGSQAGPCKNPIGDNLLLRLFKNKVDYCRIHGYDIFYNNVFLHPKMVNVWVKLPVLRATMLAHPEAEWIFWVDADAVFTDMDLSRRWRSIRTITSWCTGGAPSGYWDDFVDKFDTITDNYARIEKGVTELQRRHAEKVSEHYAAVMREAFFNKGGDGGGGKRPFVTHFMACKPCSGVHWGYTDEACWNGMEKALNFADNQVLRNYGFVRPDLLNISSLYSLPFGFSSYSKEK
ncbi:hypothetical protein Vadar_019803 [Vaccinium darrowii]|uniref:Uncharacterized protein n=1 Tax=Vaccinium darrowii TaxID=229202 RepID=A0ACB7Y1X9_9ERIC|nr:hypothetical protein Vadar_019803 [Vaccinium darrowii]